MELSQECVGDPEMLLQPVSELVFHFHYHGHPRVRPEEIGVTVHECQ